MMSMPPLRRSLSGRGGEDAKGADAEQQHRADIPLPALDFGREVPEKQDHQDHSGHKHGERIFKEEVAASMAWTE